MKKVEAFVASDGSYHDTPAKAFEAELKLLLDASGQFDNEGMARHLAAHATQLHELSRYCLPPKTR